MDAAKSIPDPPCAPEIAERRRAEQLSRGQLAVLKRTLAALAKRQDLDAFLGLVIQSIAEQLGTHSAALWLVDDDGMSRMHIDYDNGQLKSPPTSEHPRAGQSRMYHFPDGHGMRVVADGAAFLVEDIYSRPQLSFLWDYFRQRHVAGLLIVPLKLGDKIAGSVSIRIIEQRPFSEDELELAVALAQQATLAIQLTRLAEAERKAAVVQERNRLAREIHDTLAQGFTGVILQLEAAEAAIAVRPEETAASIERAKKLARQSLGEARRSVMALRPMALDGGDLCQALPKLIDGLALADDVRVRFSLTGAQRPLNPDVETNLFRIAQEALNNARKHAAASELLVTLSFDTAPPSVSLSVRDNGRGFDAKNVHLGAGGFGFISMQERADAIGAQLILASSPGGGTDVKVTYSEKR